MLEDKGHVYSAGQVFAATGCNQPLQRHYIQRGFLPKAATGTKYSRFGIKDLLLIGLIFRTAASGVHAKPYVELLRNFVEYIYSDHYVRPEKGESVLLVFAYGDGSLKSELFHGYDFYRRAVNSGASALHIVRLNMITNEILLKAGAA